MPGTWSGPVGLAAALALVLLAGGALTRGVGTFGDERPSLPPPSPAAGARGRIAPILPPDLGRTLADVVRPGRPPVLVALPAGAALGDLLAAAGLRPDMPVAGGGGLLLPGSRLVVGEDGAARLTCMPAARRLRLGLPLDVNHDGADDLDRLPGLGPVLAARIVADRERGGPFPSVRALARVPGIGPATLARIRLHVRAETGSPCRPEPRRSGGAPPR